MHVRLQQVRFLSNEASTLSGKDIYEYTVESIDHCSSLPAASPVVGEKRRRSESSGSRSEEQDDGNYGALSPDPLHIEGADSPPPDPTSSSLRFTQVAEKTRSTIAHRWTRPPSQLIPEVQEGAGGTDNETEEEEDSEQLQGVDEDGGSFVDGDEDGGGNESGNEEAENEDDGADNPDVSLSGTDIPPITFWDRISDDLAYELMTVGMCVSDDHSSY
jgi:hypothetical protein